MTTSSTVDVEIKIADLVDLVLTLEVGELFKF